MSVKLVEGVGMWVSAVGSAIDGQDTTHRVAKPQRPAPRALAAQPAVRLSCDWRGQPGKRWCSRCRWIERTSECPGSIVTTALQHNLQLRMLGKAEHMLVQITPQRESDLQREMPSVMCAACGAVGTSRASSFAAPCGHASAKGKLAIARIAKHFAPTVSAKIAVHIVPLEADDALDDAVQFGADTRPPRSPPPESAPRIQQGAPGRQLAADRPPPESAPRIQQGAVGSQGSSRSAS